MRQKTNQANIHPKPPSRRELRSRRNDLPAHLRAAHDEAIRKHVLQLVKSRQARSIACYWPFNGEPDIAPLYRQLMSEGHQLALPVVSGNDDHAMKFYPWRQDETLTPNRYGIFEPPQSTPVPLTSFDMLIMPLVGYDMQGNRMGMGSGYYDRHLEPLRNLRNPLRVGVAYSLQEVSMLDQNKWDIPLHGVVNERGWFTFVE